MAKTEGLMAREDGGLDFSCFQTGEARQLGWGGASACWYDGSGVSTARQAAVESAAWAKGMGIWAS